MSRTAIIPIRDFRGMTRLQDVFDPHVRSELGRRLASLSVVAVADAGCAPAVLTADRDVAGWAASLGVDVAPDTGTSLSTAVAASAEHLDDWMIVHADLPLVTGEAIERCLAATTGSRFAIAPSLDGGTNVLAGSGSFPFSYGPGSFTRHIAARPRAKVVVDRRLAVELDTPAHAVALSKVGALSSLDL